MKVDDFDFELPQERIAQSPLEKRDQSRLMIVDRERGFQAHRHFYDLINYLGAGDVLVINDTRVLPARLFGHRPGKEESIEVLLLNEREPDLWECLVRPGRKVKVNQDLVFGEGLLQGRVEGLSEDGSRYIRFTYGGVFLEVLEKLGTMPLPPYILEGLEDQERYQTVYSQVNGSSAAPTAGLHFTPELLAGLEAKGVVLTPLTLHVGLGTFRPVHEARVEDHVMHKEWFQISQASCDQINQARARGNKVVAVGTTSLRVLESLDLDNQGRVRESRGWTDIFIYPGYRFQLVDELITNFHLPKSTLLMLVAAFSSQAIIQEAYQEAMDQGYRFFSFGDAMYLRKDSHV